MTKRKRKDGITELSNGKFNVVVWYKNDSGDPAKKEKTFPTKSLAREWRNSFKTDLLRGEIGITTAKITLRQIVDRYLDYYENYYQSKYDVDSLRLDSRMAPIRATMSRMMEIAGESKRVIKIDHAIIESWKRLRKSEGVGNSTINDGLKHIRRCFDMARVFYVELRRWQPPKIDNLPESKKRRKRILSLSEEAAVYTELLKTAPEVADLFLLLIDTGLRLMDAVKLKPISIRFDFPPYPFGAIELATAKTEETIVIPLTQAVSQMLQRRISGDYIFSFAKGHPQTIKYNLTYRISKAAKAADIPYGRNVANGFYIHDLRRTAINRMLKRTSYDYKSVSRITGVSVKLLIEHYAREDEQQMLRAVMRGVENPLILDMNSAPTEPIR